MATSKEYLNYITDSLSDFKNIAYRQMPGAKDILLVEDADTEII